MLGLDTDGDGIPDTVAIPMMITMGLSDENDALPFDPNETSDYDGDGIGDNADTDDDNDGFDDSSRSTKTELILKMHLITLVILMVMG